MGVEQEALSIGKFLETNALLERQDIISKNWIKKKKTYLQNYLAIHGYTEIFLKRALDAGLDVAGSLEYAKYPRQKAMTAEIVVVATVKEIKIDDIIGDGFRNTIVIDVEQCLKGPCEEEVRIRQMSGEDDREIVFTPDDIFPNVGDTLIFYLSNAMYKHYVYGNTSYRQDEERLDLFGIPHYYVRQHVECYDLNGSEGSVIEVKRVVSLIDSVSNIY